MRATGALVVCGVVSAVLAGCEAGGGPEAAALAAAVPLAAALPAGAVSIYGDALASGWVDWSWGATRNLSATSPVADGTRSLAVTYQAWGGLFFHRTGGALSGMATLELYVNGGKAAGGKLSVAGRKGSSTVGTALLAPFCAGGAIPAGAWTRCDVPLTALGPAGTVFDGFWIQEAEGRARPMMYFDAVALLPGATTPPTVKVSVSPASAALDACGGVKLSATVTGAGAGVTWTVQEGAAGGSVDASGNYRAPNAAGTFHVVATSSAAPTASAVVPVTVQQRVLSVAVVPFTVTMGAGAQQQFAATVTTTCGTFAAQ